MEKTTNFNLIILDESGSMGHLTESTVAGCNETLNIIRSQEKKHGETQRNLVSIYVFQSSGELPSRYICKNQPIDKVKDITTDDYKPWGGTPLLDAVGSTLADLEAVASTHEDASASVTIITDGYENSSCEYSWQQVANMISRLKELGWNFNFIGANIDVDNVSEILNIDNAKSFTASKEGNEQMWASYSLNMASYLDDCASNEMNMSQEDKITYRKNRSKNFFNH